jgi:hypothetical protein
MQFPKTVVKRLQTIFQLRNQSPPPETKNAAKGSLPRRIATRPN